MSIASTINDFMKSLPATADPTAGNIVAVDANGNISKTSMANLKYYDLSAKEPLDAVLTVEEFVKKYVVGKQPGSMLICNDPALATKWNIKLTNTLTVSVRGYAMLVTKRVGNNFSGAYRYGSFLMIPAFETYSDIPTSLYSVSFSTGASGTFFYHVYELPFTKLI